MTSERAIDYLLFKTKFHDGNKQVVELIKALTAEVAKLREMTEAQEKLLVCYRLSKRPSEKLLDQITRLRTALTKEQP